PAGLRQALRGLRVEPPDGFAAAVLHRLGLPAADVDRYVLLDGPTGPLFVAFNDHGVSHVVPAGVVDGDAERFRARFRERFGRDVVPAHRPPPGLAAALREGRGRQLSFDLRRLTEFARATLTKAQDIPRGQVRAYAWVAREIGRPGAVRAVGSALARNPVPVLIPCHRVVRSDGTVGSYAFGSAAKRALLEHEGVDLATLSGAGDRGPR
ncbi:MAG TPA: MGMT family protein, partial [Egibacteraceae bacterium]|nr:MGMT family protein [Egibacteraceae bacterium]